MAAGLIAWIATDQFALVIDTDEWTPDIAADEFLSDVPAEARVGAAHLIPGRAIVLDSGANRARLTSEPVEIASLIGAQSEAVLVYQDGANDAARRLIGVYTTATGSPGLPILPSGGAVLITPSADGWFSI